MNLIHKTVAIGSLAIVLGGLTPLTVFAQSEQTLSNQINAEDVFKQGVDKVEKGNYQEAINDFNRMALRKAETLVV